MLYIVLWRHSPAREWTCAGVFTDKEEALYFGSMLRMRGYRADVRDVVEPEAI